MLEQYADIQKLVSLGQLKLDWTAEPEYTTGSLKVDSDIEPEQYSAALAAQEAESLAQAACQMVDILGCAASGDMILKMVPTSPVTISAASLNASKTGEAKVRVCLALMDSHNRTHAWAEWPLTMVMAETVADAEVGLPTTDPDPVLFKLGRVEFDLILDTDAGVTKGYAAGDSVTMTAKVSSDDKRMGHTVAPVVLTVDVT